MDFPHKEWYLQLWIYFMFFHTHLINIYINPNKRDLGNIHLDNLALPVSQNTYRQLIFFPWNYGLFESQNECKTVFVYQWEATLMSYNRTSIFQIKILRFMSVSDKTKLIMTKYLPYLPSICVHSLCFSLVQSSRTSWVHKVLYYPVKYQKLGVTIEKHA